MNPRPGLAKFPMSGKTAGRSAGSQPVPRGERRRVLLDRGGRDPPPPAVGVVRPAELERGEDAAARTGHAVEVAPPHRVAHHEEVAPPPVIGPDRRPRARRLQGPAEVREREGRHAVGDPHLDRGVVEARIAWLSCVSSPAWSPGWFWCVSKPPSRAEEDLPLEAQHGRGLVELHDLRHLQELVAERGGGEHGGQRGIDGEGLGDVDGLLGGVGGRADQRALPDRACAGSSSPGGGPARQPPPRSRSAPGPG